jgi:hypothetical protein
MDYKNLINDAWTYTQSNKKLIRWFGFLPSILTTTVGAGYIAYQFFAFRESYVFSEEDHSFAYDIVSFLWVFIQDHLSWTFPLVVVVVIFALLYILFPTLAKASAIQVIARHKNGQKAGIGNGLKQGLMTFLPLFEYHILIKTFAFFSILVEMSFVLRNLGPVIFKILMPIFIIFLIIGFILTLLFTYTDFFIVVDGEKVFPAIKKSTRLVILHWKHTFLVTLLMVLIGIRIVIQVIMVFLIPVMVVILTSYLATVLLPATSIIIGGIVGLIAILGAAYMNGIVDIFAYAVWTFTFLYLSEQEELTARESAFVDDIKEGGPDDHYHGHKNLS